MTAHMRRRQHRYGHGAPAWPAEEVARLLELKARGLQPADIAPLMGRSRCSIVGKLDRLKAGEGRGLRRRLKEEREPGDRSAGTQAAALLHKARQAKKAVVKRGSAKHPDGKNNNPTGWNGRQGSSRGPDGLPKPLPHVARAAIVDLGPHQCRYIGERPEVVTIDTPIYCGAAMDGGAWCSEHRAGVFDRRRARA